MTEFPRIWNPSLFSRASSTLSSGQRVSEYILTVIGWECHEMLSMLNNMALHSRTVAPRKTLLQSFLLCQWWSSAKCSCGFNTLLYLLILLLIWQRQALAGRHTLLQLLTLHLFWQSILLMSWILIIFLFETVICSFPLKHICYVKKWVNLKKHIR